jgi:exonuclease III
MQYITLRGRWFHIIVLNVHAPTEDKTDDVKDSFYGELECIFNKFSKHHMNIVLGDVNAKVGKEDIFKPTYGNERLHEITNDNGVRVVNFATSKNLMVKSTMLPHRNIHKYTWTSPDGNTHNQFDNILIRQVKAFIPVYLMSDHSGQQTVIWTTIRRWQKLGGD